MSKGLKSLFLGTTLLVAAGAANAIPTTEVNQDHEGTTVSALSPYSTATDFGGPVGTLSPIEIVPVSDTKCLWAAQNVWPEGCLILNGPLILNTNPNDPDWMGAVWDIQDRRSIHFPITDSLADAVVEAGLGSSFEWETPIGNDMASLQAFYFEPGVHDLASGGHSAIKDVKAPGVLLLVAVGLIGAGLAFRTNRQQDYRQQASQEPANTLGPS